MAIAADGAASEESQLALLLDELTTAFQAGLQPDVEQVAQRHPTLASDLRSLWATIWVAEAMAKNGSLEEKKGGESDAAFETASWPSPTELRGCTIIEFRIARIGRWSLRRLRAL